MSTITIPASEIRAGDILDLGGQPLEVAAVNSVSATRITAVAVRGAHGVIVALPLNSDDHYGVQRPDPDAELVDVMARELARVEREAGLAIEWERLTDEGGRKLYRDQARAALATARDWVVAS